MQAHFRTIVNPSKPSFSVTHDDRIMSIGSCFSENVGKCFEQYKFDIDINPFGQQYNPFSITNAINRLLDPKPYAESDLVFRDELYHSMDHHGSFSKPNAAEALDGINSSLQSAAQGLNEASLLFLTFGTSHVFKTKATGKIVSNCHKIPGSEFDFALMAPEEIVAAMTAALEALWAKNPSVRVVLTVSPVRYFAFGQFENSVSKGHLFAAAQTLLKKYASLYYFPAYEIVMDELRDYRFFADDMLHPNQLATKYVWDQLAKTLLPLDTQHTLGALDEITAAANHRPRNPQSEAHKRFKEIYLSKMKWMEEKHGFDFAAERDKLLK